MARRVHKADNGTVTPCPVVNASFDEFPSPAHCYDRSPLYTDHSDEIKMLRTRATTESLAAAALLEVHDTTGISLDDWKPVRDFVEKYLGRPILRNGV